MMSLSKAEPDRADAAGKSTGPEARIPTGAAQTEVRHSNGEAPAATAATTTVSRGSRKNIRSRSRRVDEGKAGLDAPDAAEAVVEGGSAPTRSSELHHHTVAFVEDEATKTEASTLPEANAEASANGDGDKRQDAQVRNSTGKGRALITYHIRCTSLFVLQLSDFFSRSRVIFLPQVFFPVPHSGYGITGATRFLCPRVIFECSYFLF